MKTNDFIFPFYIKASIFSIGLLSMFSILYFAGEVITPIIFAVIIAVLLNPVVNFFERIKIPRLIAIILTLLITSLFLAAFAALILSQVSRFFESWPSLVEKFTYSINHVITFISGFFDINRIKILEWVEKNKNELLNLNSASIGHILVLLSTRLMELILVPVYIFMILFYKHLLLEFIHRIFIKNNLEQVNQVVSQTETVIQRYLVGLVIEAGIIAALYTVTLLILDIDYAFLLGIIGALINVIPYVGGIVSVSLPMIVALGTKSSGWSAVYILIIFFIIQFIDNHYIIPKVVASKVKINALFSIIIVIAGNALWGVPGMFLAIPLLAIVKVLLDNIEPLKPWGYLLGDTMPELFKIESIIKIIKKKIVKKPVKIK